MGRGAYAPLALKEAFTIKYLMGLDNGGTSVKAAIFDEYGKQAASASENLDTITPAPGFAERDMEALWQANARVIGKCIEESGLNPGDIAGISFSGHGKGLYLVDGRGTPAYNGILSQDVRAWEYVEGWQKDGTAERVFEKSLQTILACQPVSLLAWLRDNEPRVLANTRWIFSVKDYIRFRLTGRAYGEYTDFSGGNLVNLNTRAYDRELLECFGLSDCFDKLPELKYSSELCGYITEAAAALTKLAPGTPAAAGMFDVDACGLASGLIEERGMCMVAGTWSINEYISKKPVTNGTVDLNSMYCMPGYFLVEESSPTSAGNLEWFVRQFMSESGAAAYEEANRLVEATPPEESGVIFLPFINGSNEDALAKAAWIGLTAFHEKRHALRALYEGIVFSHLTHVNKLLKNRARPESVRLSGGAARSQVWVQMFADALQLPIEITEDKELGCQGAAIAAGLAAGVYADYTDAVNKTSGNKRLIHPRGENAGIYAAKYAAYRAVIESLSGVWKLLHTRESS